MKQAFWPTSHKSAVKTKIQVIFRLLIEVRPYEALYIGHWSSRNSQNNQGVV